MLAALVFHFASGKTDLVFYERYKKSKVNLTKYQTLFQTTSGLFYNVADVLPKHFPSVTKSKPDLYIHSEGSINVPSEYETNIRPKLQSLHTLYTYVRT
jgi:uncharacterized protein with NRDE domain